MGRVQMAFALLLLAGCGSTSGSSVRVATDKDTGAKGVDMQDFLNVTESLASSLVACDAVAKAKVPPMVAIETLMNKSTTVMDMSAYTSKVRTTLIKHGAGRVQFVDREATRQVTNERELKERPDVTGKVKQGIASADYFLRGELHEFVNKASKSTYRGYRFVMRLTSADSGVIVWEDEREFQKKETRGSFNP